MELVPTKFVSVSQLTQSHISCPHIRGKARMPFFDFDKLFLLEKSNGLIRLQA
jgi:hypothetical protein